MKKPGLVLLCLMLALVMIFSFVACGEQSETDGNDDPTNGIKLTINETAITLCVGRSDKLEAEPDKKVDGVSVEWFTSDEKIAKVSLTGRVTAVAEGTATITAYYGQASVSCKVSVIPVTVQLDKLEAEIDFTLGSTLKLNATDNGDINEYDWSSSDPTVATVDGDGLVTAHKNGSTVITASIGKASASCKVTVKNMSDSYYVLTSGNGATVYANPGKFYLFGSATGYFDGEKAVLNVDNSSKTEYYLRYWPDTSGYETGALFDAECTVTSTKAGYLRLGNSEFVEVKANEPTEVIFHDRAVKADSALSIALCNSKSSTDFASGKYTLTCTEIVIIEKTEDSVTLSAKEAFAVAGGEAVTLTVESGGKNVVWSSSDEDVLTVSGGVITAVGRGKATVTATVEGGDASDSCEVFVAAAEDKVNATYGDGSEHVPSTSTSDPYEDGDWCQNKIGDNDRADYVTMNNGVFTVTSDKQYTEESYIRYMFAHSGAVQNAGSSFYIVFNLSNDTDSNLSYCTTLNGEKDYTYLTLNTGESARYINKHTITESTYLLNIRLKNYGAGTLTFSDIYIIPEVITETPDSVTLSADEALLADDELGMTDDIVQ